MPVETVKELLDSRAGITNSGQRQWGWKTLSRDATSFIPKKDVIDIKTASGEGTEIIIRLHTEVDPCIEL